MTPQPQSVKVLCYDRETGLTTESLNSTFKNTGIITLRNDRSAYSNGATLSLQFVAGSSRFSHNSPTFQRINFDNISQFHSKVSEMDSFSVRPFRLEQLKWAKTQLLANEIEARSLHDTPFILHKAFTTV